MSKITEETSVKTDIKTIVTIIAAAGFAVYTYIGLTNTINTLETRLLSSSFSVELPEEVRVTLAASGW